MKAHIPFVQGLQQSSGLLQLSRTDTAHRYFSACFTLPLLKR